MNILWIYDTPLIPEAGGTERMTSLIAKGLTRDGHNCMGQMVVNQDSSFVLDGKQISNLYDFLKENNIDFVINQECRHVSILKQFLDNGGNQWHEEGGKIISCLHFDPHVTSTLYHFKVKLNKTLRDRYSLLRAIMSSKRDKKRIDKKLGEQYRWLYNNSDYFITLSEQFNPYFREVTGLKDANKLMSINNPLTFDTISSPDIVDSKKKVVLICGRMNEYQKRISLALRAWKKLKKDGISSDWTLKIVGTGADLQQYIEMVERQNILDVRFEGRQDSEPYFAEASMFLMTSGYEGWGLTLTESLQRGVVPIVMDNAPVFREIIQNGYNGYLTKKDSIGDLVKHILILMSDDRRLNAMQSNALISARRFALDKTMEKWRKIIPSANTQS